VSETLFRVTTHNAVFGVVVNDQTLKVVDCAPIGRTALMGKTFGGAITYCHGRRWRMETVRPAVEEEERPLDQRLRAAGAPMLPGMDA
jgi:hypothetical protein